MRKLLEALASWRGPEELGQEIASRGFLIPHLYRQKLIEYCRANCMDCGLETYWAECAKERIFSGGRVDPRRRQFRGEAPYRSPYLDRLAAERERLPPSRVPELHPCLRRWIEEIKFERKDFGRVLSNDLENSKEGECQRHAISPEGWTGKKKDIKPILRRFAERKGFKEKRLEVRGRGWTTGIGSGGGKAFCKELPNGLLFHFWVDVGWLRDVSPRLPLMFFVSHIEDPLPPLGAGPDAVYVGADHYAVFRTPSTAVLGICALVEIFDAFASTFG